MAVFLLTAATPGAHSSRAHTPHRWDAGLLPSRKPQGAPKARATVTLTREENKDLSRPASHGRTEPPHSAPALNNGPGSCLTTSDLAEERAHWPETAPAVGPLDGTAVAPGAPPSAR